MATTRNPAPDDGYRVIADTTKCAQCQTTVRDTFWVIDAHGETAAGPFCSKRCARTWLGNFRDLRAHRQETVQAEQRALYDKWNREGLGTDHYTPEDDAL